MKKLLIILFVLLLIHNNLAAQATWVSYSTQLPTKDYRGHKFKFSASVKTDELDQKAAAYLWVRGNKATKEPTFSDDMRKRPIKSKEWKTYSIEGVIDSNTVKMAFGVLVFYNGLFYYDDMKLEVEKTENTWETVYSNNFEQDTLTLKEGIQIQVQLNEPTNTNFTASLEKKGENQYLKIDGANIVDYGNNERVGKYAEVNGVRLYYEIYGQGQPLIVLHDFHYTIGSQAPYYPELMKKYQLILVNMRGQNYGMRIGKDDSLTYEVMASDVNQLMEQLKIDSAHLLGVVAGAKVGLLMARDYPQKVKKLLTYGLFIQSDSTAVSPLSFKRFEDMAKQTKDLQEKKVLDLLLKKEALNISVSELSVLKIPVILVSGDKGFIQKEHTENIAKMLPNAKVHILAGGGNNIVYTKNEAFLSIMEAFFWQMK
jgi:pimeloyl-ACP methyl ester carboxylesterase